LIKTLFLRKHHFCQKINKVMPLNPVKGEKQYTIYNIQYPLKMKTNLILTLFTILHIFKHFNSGHIEDLLHFP
jgi:hypothetical protein